MIQKLDQIEKRYHEIQGLASDPGVIRDQSRYRELMRESAGLEEIVETYGAYKKLLKDMEGNRHVIQEGGDPELVAMAREELRELKEKEEEMSHQLKLLLVPKDPLDTKNIIMEIRAGTGGEEAALFAADLFRMYSRYAESRRWTIEILSSHQTEIRGFKEIVFSIAGKSVYESLRYESGVHRVQRVPVTEAGGRIHTSAVTVAVLPEVEATEVEIHPEELRVDVFRSSGPGGQSVNTTDSAVRITHVPTGLVVTCQDEKSQHKNKAKALRVLRARLFEVEEEKKQSERAQARRAQVGTGDRSERIRTYNFPQNRVTDHRINLTLYRLEQIMLGDLEELLESLKISAREEALKKLAV
ncbi:MAG: peptide chain release factor 1 [Spirochaetales bacterium]|nr:peptide chain release factor 1 [Spirochaetales bacterium]